LKPQYGSSLGLPVDLAPSGGLKGLRRFMIVLPDRLVAGSPSREN
jgi:hypothetical protein